MTITFPNYELWTIMSLIISVYNFFGTDWRKARIKPWTWMILSFIPVIHVISGGVNLLYLGENQHLIKDNKLNRWLGFEF